MDARESTASLVYRVASLVYIVSSSSENLKSRLFYVSSYFSVAMVKYLDHKSNLWKKEYWFLVLVFGLGLQFQRGKRPLWQEGIAAGSRSRMLRDLPTINTKQKEQWKLG